MAERRMFARTIVLSDAFLDMPMSARCLYFTLAMFADDEGFVNNPKAIMRQCGASNDDMNVLIAKKFVILFESGVIVIKHWKIHNYIRGDRIKETKYQEEKNQLSLDDNNAYTLDNSIPAVICPSNDSQLTGNCHTQDRLGKDRLGKDSNIISSEPSGEAADSLLAESAVFGLPLNDGSEYPIYQSDIDKWSQLYPAVNVTQELRNMIGWLDASPSRRKTKSGIKRFVNAWLSKNQNSGGARSSPKTAEGRTVDEQRFNDINF